MAINPETPLPQPRHLIDILPIQEKFVSIPEAVQSFITPEHLSNPELPLYFPIRDTHIFDDIRTGRGSIEPLIKPDLIITAEEINTEKVSVTHRFALIDLRQLSRNENFLASPDLQQSLLLAINQELRTLYPIANPLMAQSYTRRINAHTNTLTDGKSRSEDEIKRLNQEITDAKAKIEDINKQPIVAEYRSAIDTLSQAAEVFITEHTNIRKAIDEEAARQTISKDEIKAFRKIKYASIRRLAANEIHTILSDAYQEVSDTNDIALLTAIRDRFLGQFQIEVNNPIDESLLDEFINQGNLYTLLKAMEEAAGLILLRLPNRTLLEKYKQTFGQVNQIYPNFYLNQRSGMISLKEIVTMSRELVK